MACSRKLGRGPGYRAHEWEPCEREISVQPGNKKLSVEPGYKKLSVVPGNKKLSVEQEVCSGTR